MGHDITGDPSFSRRGRRRGFTLVEVAIVFAIFGLVVAGVFFAATNVRQHVQLNQGLDEISQTVGNMRALYASRNASAVAAQGVTNAFEQQLIAQKVFPNEMLCGPPTPGCAVTYAYNPWSLTGTAPGTATIGLSGGGQFYLAYSGIPSNVCISLLTSNSTPGADTGLQKITVNGTAVAALPVLADVAATACSRSATNTIAWFYTLGS